MALFETITISLTPKEVKMLRAMSRKMDLTETDVIGIALYELFDLLKTNPIVDYNAELGGWLLRKKK
jgi:hypothetical protein